MNLRAGQANIGRVRAATSESDRLAFQLRLSRLLGATSLHPTNLPATAILCVRYLPALLPAGWHKGTSLPASWQQSVSITLNHLASDALRPARDPVPPDARAVVFADRAELLACLASDWCNHELRAHWWWQNILPGLDPAGEVVTAWRETPQYIPAALEHLTALGKALAFAQALNEQQASALLNCLTNAFGLPEIEVALAQIQPARPAVSRGELPTSRLVPDSEPPNPINLQPPWSSWILENSQAKLTITQQTLLSVGLMLQRAPQALRRPLFVAQLRHWLEVTNGQVSVTSREAALSYQPSAISPQLSANQDVASSSRLALNEVAPDASVITPASNEMMHRQLEVTPTPQGSLTNKQALNISPFTGVFLDTKVLDNQGYVNLENSSTLTVEATSSSDEWLPEAENLREARIKTELGGLFYLINLGLFLDLYGDFTSPARPGIELPIWDFVTLAGQRLLRDYPPDDPVWPLLAGLAGRGPENNPGQFYTPPTQWRLSPKWLTPFGEESGGQWYINHNRLQAFHPAGFTLLNVPLTDEDPLTQLECEVQRYAGLVRFEPVPTALVMPAEATTSLQCWLGWLLPYVEARLERALGVARPGKLLGYHPAQIYLTATHLDVVLPLAGLPLEIRLAGLDRNPGWVPAAGRFISFYFE